MKHYLSLHLEAACQAFARLVRQPLGTLMVLLMLAAAMTLPLMLYLGVQSSTEVLGRLNQAPQMTIYLTPEAAEADIAAARQALERRPYEARAAAALTQARWMAEELRVSMFAQTLGTPNKVSMKRLLGVLAGAR